MNLGYIYCEDSHNPNQEYWIDAFKMIFDNYGIEPHRITDPSQAREGYYYVWRPSAGNFKGIYKNSKQLSDNLSLLAKKYEETGAKIFPNSKNLQFYENKVEIAKHVNKLGIKAPKTRYYNTKEEAMDDKGNIRFPVLLKHAFSCNSYGMMKADDANEYAKNLAVIGDNISSYIIQERIKISRDIRINYVDHQNVISYSRFIADNQISSASRFKSQIDHFSIPLNAFQYAYKIGELFEFPFGGIDFAWAEGDNVYQTDPYLLEISPIFDVNPMPMKPTKDWGKFKKSWNWKKYYKQTILQAANLEISYIIYKYQNR